MKKTRKIRFLAFILTLCMTLGALPLYVLADEGEEIPEELQDRIVEEVPFEPEYLPGDLTFAECRTATLNLADVPAVISPAQIEKYQHVNRLYEQEPDLYTVIFQNRDGSKTVYVFAQPVKSTLGNGAVADMSAAAIVSAHQPALPSQNAMMQSSLSQNVAPILAMQERLDAYKAANDLKDYQMLDDVLETTTVNASAASVLVINNSVSVASVSTTYSPLFGEYAIKLPNDTGYLTNLNGIRALSAVAVPYSKWFFEYYGNGKYAIQSLAKQGYYLAYVDGDSCGLEQWEDNDEGNEEIMWSVYADQDQTGFVFSLGGYFLSDYAAMIDSSYEPVCVLTNHEEFVPLNTINIDSSVITATSGEYVSFPSKTVNPSNASYANPNLDFTWCSTDEDAVYFDLDEVYANSPGVAQIYCKHLYTGIESNRVTVIVSEAPPAGEAITSGAVYLIRPYAETINASTPLLTMNVGSSGNTLSLSAWDDTWDDLSQAFTLTQNADGSYIIAAVMSTNQYDVPFNGLAQVPYNSVYTLKDKNTVSNILSCTSSAGIVMKAALDASGNSQITANDRWYISYNSSTKEFFIANSSANGVYYLTNANNTIGVSTQKNNASWSITYLGIDVPCIKQKTSTCCGATSALQVTYARGLVDKTQSLTTLQNQLIATFQNSYGVNFSQGVDSRTVTDYLKSVVPVVTHPKSYRLVPKTGSGCFDNKEEFEDYLNACISQGYPAIIHSNATALKNMSYYGPNHAYVQYDSGHFITVMGYDSITKKAILSDCHFDDLYFGIHVVSLDNLYAALTGLIFHRN